MFRHVHEDWFMQSMHLLLLVNKAQCDPGSASEHSWYSRERVAKTDIYISYFYFPHKKYSRSFMTLGLNQWCHMDYFKYVCDEWGGAESRGNGARPVEWMIMNDTCATHRSRVPRRSFGRNKRRSDDIGRGERTRPGFLSSAPLVTYPHRPSQAGGYSRDCALLPPSPLSRGEPVRAAAAYLGVRTDEARERRRKDEEWQRRERGERRKKKISVRFPDTLPLGPQPAERFTRGAMRWYWTSLVDGPMLIRLLADGGGSSGRGQPAASPPFPAPPQTWRMAAGFGLQANGATPPLPLGRQPPLLDPGARQRVFRPTCSSFAPAPPLRAATGGLRHFLLPDLLSTAIPLSSEGSLTACPSFLPGFGTNVTQSIYTGRRRREPANIQQL